MKVKANLHVRPQSFTPHVHQRSFMLDARPQAFTFLAKRRGLTLDARRAFTLIELLVVISIIGILASLILPAVVNARRQGRRVQCLNNMTNIGKGMFSYVTQKNQFPASGYWDVTTASSEKQDPRILDKTLAHPDELLTKTNEWAWGAGGSFAGSAINSFEEDGPTTGLKYSWVVELLPYIGSQNLYDAWDFSSTPLHSAVGGNRGWYLDNTPGTAKRGNAELSNTYLEVLVCPEDVTSQQSQGSISYVVNGGFAPHWLVWYDLNSDGGSVLLRQIDRMVYVPSGSGWHRQNLRNMGLMFLDTTTGGTDAHRRHTLESIRDGASFTAMLSENINAGPGSQYAGMGINSSWACPFPLNTSFFVNPVSAFGLEQPFDHSIPNAGKYQYSKCNNRGSLAPPAAKTDDGTNNQGGINGDITGINEGQFPYPNSMHPGGVHVVMCDGNVRFIPENIASEVWARLVTPNGGALQWGNTESAWARLNFETIPSGYSPDKYPVGNRQVPLSEGDIPSG